MPATPIPQPPALRRAAGLGLLALLAGCRACGDSGPSPSPSGSTAGSSAARPAAADELRLRIVYGSEKKTWLEEQARAFEASGARVGGKRITIEGKAMGSGEAQAAILAGEVQPVVYSPASGAYVTLLNDAWMTPSRGHRKALAPAGEPLVLSPIVIATWKPMAEALGWPAKALGWSDLIKVATQPAGWGAYGHPEWGRFKLGHTHPEYSNSGLLAVLAEAYAGAGKTRGLAPADLDGKGVVSLLRSVEGAIVHYGKSTGFFADKMRARGPNWLSAVVMYENLVVESYAASPAPTFPIVSLYPREGTFWSDHPYCVLDAEWVTEGERQAAQAFLAFLKARPAQERALALGFRPADPAIAIGAPIDAAHGADPRQPQTLLEVPDAATLQRLLAVWQTAKRATDVILVFDKSGSMEGQPLAQAKLGARTFLDTLHPADTVTLLAFDNNLYPPLGPLRLGDRKAELAARIDGLFAGGGTALYDATARAVEQARAQARAQPQRNHAVLVMTDGVDESSRLTLEALEQAIGAGEADQAVSVFAIAYGPSASMKVLGAIAEAARGTATAGNVKDIVQVFQDVAAFF